MENKDYVNRLNHVTVLGAAGKMGSGILFLTALEMVALKQKPENQNSEFSLFAMDISEEGLKGVMEYVKKQTRKLGEKKIDKIKDMYADIPGLGSDEAVIDRYVSDVMSVIKPVTQPDSAYQSTLIFEAVSEDQALKVKILSDINANNTKKPWFLTNTSSVPIHELNEQAGLGGRIVGFHFYNPPAIQRLVELIVAEKTITELSDFTHLLVTRLGKIMVPSNDIAGFIGNGHFMRDALYGIEQAEKIAEKYSFAEAVYMINTVSQKFLIRPMGIFQLIDYVGVDVVQLIMKVMNPHLPDENLHSPVLDRLNELGFKGGQNPDGSQKNGFLRYVEGKVTGVFDTESNSYIPVQDFKAKVNEILGPMPENMLPWKEVIRDPEKDKKLQSIFHTMTSMETEGAILALEYGRKSKEIGYQLVNNHVAKDEKDVNTVLLTGFFHAYGPINNFFN